jgi:hypothetical protein
MGPEANAGLGRESQQSWAPTSPANIKLLNGIGASPASPAGVPDNIDGHRMVKPEIISIPNPMQRRGY